MLSKQERLLGRIALERGAIGADALARAIEAKERAGASAPDLAEILVSQGAISREQQRALSDALRDAARRRAAVKWAVERAGRDAEPAAGDLPAVIEGEGDWAGVAEVEIPPAGSIPPPPAPAPGAAPRPASQGAAHAAQAAPDRPSPPPAPPRRDSPPAAPSAPGAPRPVSRALVTIAGAADPNAPTLRGAAPAVPGGAPPPATARGLPAVPPAGATATATPAPSAPAAPSPPPSPPSRGQPAVAAPSALAPAGGKRPDPAVEEDLAVAKVAMERGLVTLAEVRESLQAQADFAAIGRPLPLGQVLIKRRAIDVDTFVDVAREARERSVRCGSCGVLSLLPRSVAGAESTLEGRCPRCGAAFPVRPGSGPAAAPPAPIPPRPVSDRGVPYRPRPAPSPLPAPSPPPPETPPPLQRSAPIASPVPAPASLGEPPPGFATLADAAADAVTGGGGIPDDIPLSDSEPLPSTPLGGIAAVGAGGDGALVSGSSSAELGPYDIHPGAFAPSPSSSGAAVSGPDLRLDAAPRPAPAAPSAPAPPAAPTAPAPGAAPAAAARPGPAAPPAAAPVVAPAPPGGKPKRPHENLAGKVFGAYEILAEIARGGMGVVYRAKDAAHGRVVALKVLKDGVAASDKQIRRFKRETEAVAKLKHPFIVPVYDVGCEGGRHYFTMEFVDGLPVDELIRRGPVDVEKALRISEGVARAMHHAHEKGVIHRDIKPANVLLDRGGNPHITDFGLAKNVDRVSAMTKTGAAVGTPFYMPPEQAKGDAKLIDHRVDVYAIGVVLYEMLTTELPFDGETTLEVYHKILQDEAPLPSRLNAAVDSDVDTIVRTCMAKERDARYATALELADDIRRKLEGKPILARPPGAISVAASKVRRAAPNAALVGGAILLALLVAGVVAVVKSAREKEAREAAIAGDWRDFHDRVRARLKGAASDRQAALARLAEGRPADSVRIAEAALRAIERPRDWVEGAGGVRFRDENLERARRLVAEAERETPELARELFLVKARAHAAGAAPGDRAALDAALEAADRSLAIDGARPEAHLERGRVLERLGRLGDAHAALSAAVERSGKAPEVAADARQARGLLRARLGAHEGAAEDLLEAEALERRRVGRGGTADYSTTDHQPTRLSEMMMARALSLGALGRLADARAVLKELTNADGGLHAAYLALSELERRAGNLDAAEAAANEAIKANESPKWPDGQVALGRVHLRRGRAAQAEQAFAEAARRDPGDARAHLLRALALEWLLRPDPALASLEAAIACPASARNDPSRALAALRAGERARMAEERRRAGAEGAGGERGATGALAPFPGSPDEALRRYEEAIAIDPCLAAAHLARCRLLARAGDPAAAAKDVARAAELPVDRAALLEAEGRRLLALGGAENAAAAAAKLEEARAAAPGPAAPPGRLEALGHALARAGDAPRSASAFADALDAARALEDEPKSWERPVAAALLRAALEEGPGASPGEEAALLYRIGLAALEEGRSLPSQAAGARIAFERAASLAPGFVAADLAHARILRPEGPERAAEALHALDRAVRANPRCADALVERGTLRLDVAAARGATDTAAVRSAAREGLLDLDRALELEPGRRDARLGRARALALAGETAAASEEIERVVDAAVGEEGEQAKAFLAGAYDVRAAVRRAEGRLDLARADLVRAAELRAANRKIARERLEEGRRLFQSNRQLDAIEQFSQAIAADRTFADAWYERASARFIYSEMLLDAALDVGRALELSPRYADAVFERASESYDQIDLSQLYVGIEEHLKSSPDDASALFIRGLYGCVRTYIGKSEPEEREAALAALDRTIRLSPQHAFAHVCRGYLLQNKGELDEALRAVRRAEALDDRSVLAPFLHGLVHAKRGEKEHALAALERALERGFRSGERLRAEPAFSILHDDPRWKAILERVPPPPGR